jgi:hypothetical protein
VIGTVLNVYVDLSRGSQRAMEGTQVVRRSAALLDRVGRDLEGATLVTKPPELDPLYHPWRFTGESLRDTSGADHLKFVTRSRRPRGSAHESDLEVVAYSLRPAEDGETYELLRWSSPRLDDALQEDIPAYEEDGAMILADDLVDFGVVFVDELGERTTSWDSTQLEDAGGLPAAVEIQVAFAEPGGRRVDAFEEDGVRGYRRSVVLPMRPIDLEELFDPASLVSGGPGRPDEISQEDPEFEEWASKDCLEGPCGRMTACQAINCTAELGQHGKSVDDALRLTMANNMPFCAWTRAFSTLRRLIDNPACRP